MPEHLRPYLGNAQLFSFFIAALVEVLIYALFFIRLRQKQYGAAIVYFMHMIIIYKLSGIVHFFAFRVLEKVIIE